MKIKKKIKRITYYLVTSLLIFFMTFILITWYSKRINNNLKKLVSTAFQKEIYNSLDNMLKTGTSGSNIDDILEIVQNKNGDILYVDYNLEKSYEYLNKVTTNIKDNLNKEKGITFKVPFMVASDNILFSNFGPKITIRINYINSILANVYTKITNYGLNNALVEAYIKINIEGHIITPVFEDENIVTYDLLVASKVINGKVPSLYGDYFTSNSSIFDIPIN